MSSGLKSDGDGLYEKISFWGSKMIFFKFYEKSVHDNSSDFLHEVTIAWRFKIDLNKLFGKSLALTF